MGEIAQLPAKQTTPPTPPAPPTLTELQWNTLATFWQRAENARLAAEATAKEAELMAAQLQLAFGLVAESAGLNGWIVDPVNRTLTPHPPVDAD